MKRAAVLILAATALVAGCASTPPSESTPPPLSPPAPTEGDTVLSIAAIATADNGAELAITIEVQASLEASSPAAEELRTTLTDACGPDFVTDEKLDEESWGLVRIDVAADSVGETAWPDDAALSLVTAPRGTPGAAAIAASDGPFLTPQDPAGELGPCLVDQQLTGAGTGYLVLGIRHDFASADAQGVFWNGYRYGVSNLVFGESVDIAFRQCTIVKTPLGEELAGPEIGYDQRADASECSAGIPPIQ